MFLVLIFLKMEIINLIFLDKLVLKNSKLQDLE